MSAKGVFNDIDVAMMVHPSSGITQINRPNLIGQYIDVIFKGKTAHAAGTIGVKKRIALACHPW